MARGFFGGLASGQRAKRELDEARELRFLKERDLESQIEDRQRGRSLQERQINIQENRASVLNKATNAQITREKQTEIRSAADDIIKATADAVNAHLDAGGSPDAVQRIVDEVGGQAVGLLNAAGIDSTAHSAMLQSLKTRPEAFPMDTPVDELTPQQMRIGLSGGDNAVLEIIKEDDIFKLLDKRTGTVHDFDRQRGVQAGNEPAPAPAEAADIGGLSEAPAAFGGDAAVTGAINAFLGPLTGSRAPFSGRTEAAAAAQNLNLEITGLLRAASEGKEVAAQTEKFLESLPEPTNLLNLLGSNQSAAKAKYEEAALRMANERQGIEQELASGAKMTANRRSELRQMRTKMLNLEAKLAGALDALDDDAGPAFENFIQDAR